jgi:hypothetical protein
MRRRIATIAATLAGLAALSFVGWLVRRPAPAPVDPNTPHRVAFDVTPMEAALWFANRYPRYFSSGEGELEAWLATLDPRDRVFVQAMAQTLLWAWVEHELANIDADTPDAVARAVIGLVRHKTLNQLELNFDRFTEAEGIELYTYVGDPGFVDGAFARLVRGASNCEGQNYLAGVLIEAALAPRWPWQPRAWFEISGVWIGSGHDLVRMHRSDFGQPMYVDAWANLPPFSVDPSRPAVAPDASTFASDVALLPGMRGRPMAAPAEYASTPGVRVELLPGRDAPTMPVDLPIAAPDLAPDRLGRFGPWRLFAFARVLHLWDDPRAAELYRYVLDHHCEPPDSQRVYVCVAAELLAKRL